MKTLSLAFCALVLSGPLAIAQTNQTTKDHSEMDHSAISAEKMESAVHTKAVVNAFGDGTANVSHEPIPEIGWPAMTMDLAVLEDAQMTGDVAAGDTVTLMLIKGDDGIYSIAAMVAE
jgi:Cu/Ag efflux protein CusF